MGLKMSRCTILLPVFYNDRTLIPQCITDDLLQLISDQFGGYTITGRVKGVWGYCKEEMLSVFVAVKPDEIQLLSDMVRNHGYRTKQQCMYIEVIPDCVELLDATYCEFLKVYDKGTDND